MKNKKIIILIIVAVVAILGIISSFCIYNSYYKTELKSVTNNGNNIVISPKTIFDATATIPNTNISFKYPSNGFYNLGIDITKNEKIKNRKLIGGIHIESTLEFDINKRGDYVIVEISLLENEKKLVGINDFIKDYKQDSNVTIFEKGYAEENGRFINIDGTEYFIFKVTEDAIRWYAFALNDDNDIVYTTLTYTGGGVDYNDELFLEILKNIELK